MKLEDLPHQHIIEMAVSRHPTLALFHSFPRCRTKTKRFNTSRETTIFQDIHAEPVNTRNTVARWDEKVDMSVQKRDGKTM